MWKQVYTLALLGLISGCSSLLPVSHSDTSTFQSFDEARTAVASLVPMKSTKGGAEANGVDFAKLPNTKILTHSDIVRLLVPTGLLKREDLEPGILVCLEARDACNGLDINASRITKTRTGNFFADFINYRQRTETKGWRFNALILYVNDLVVYRSWGGQPKVDELDVATKPLGPFQDIGPAMVSGK
ncbi:MAG: hypothetical protein V4858_20005 [Pseudomonadota bacterium]